MRVEISRFNYTWILESIVIESLVRNMPYIMLKGLRNNCQCYTLQKVNIDKFSVILKEEMVRQNEKGIFKRRKTRTLGELKLLIDLLESVQNDYKIKSDDEAVAFLIDRSPRLLDI